MTVALSLSLALAALGLWAWIGSTFIMIIVRMFNKNAMPAFTYAKSFALFALPMTMLVCIAIATKTGNA